MQAQARRFSRAGVMLIGLVLTLLSVVPAAKADRYNPADFAPMVWSDKGDYAPGELVTLSGEHWKPGETVHIRVNDDTSSSWDRDVDVTADETGGIADQFNLPNWFVAKYRVTATGASGAVATHTFTDANPQSVQIAPGSRTVAPGVERAVHRLRSDCRQRRSLHPRLERERASRGCDGDIRQHQPDWSQGGQPEHVAHRRDDRRDAARNDDVHRHRGATFELPRERRLDGPREPGGREVGRCGRGRRTGRAADDRDGRDRHLSGHREPKRHYGNGVHRQPERDRPACGRDRIVQPEQRQLRERRHLEDLHPDDHDDVGGSRRLDPLHCPRDEPERHR